MAPQAAPRLALAARDIASSANDFRSSFSSWDKCMSKAYCKWPVIAAIVIVSLILISTLFCLARCICCGAECACCCFRCCASCCGGGRKKKGHERVPSNTANNGFVGRPISSQYRSHAAPTYEPPQYAQFDVSSSSKPNNPDALPAMPSWGDAESRKVEDNTVAAQETGVELDKLDKDGNSANVAAAVPMLTTPANGRSPIRSPESTVQPPNDGYGFPGAYQQSNGSFASGVGRQGSSRSPRPYYDQGQEGAYTPSQGGYRRPSPHQAYGGGQSDYFGGNAGYSNLQQQSPQAPHEQAYMGARRSPRPQYQEQDSYNSGSNHTGYNNYNSPQGYPEQHRSPPPQYGPGSNFQHNDSYGESRYSPPGSTRYDNSNAGYADQGYGNGSGHQGYDHQHQYDQGQGGWQQQQPPMQRKPVNGSWRDI